MIQFANLLAFINLRNTMISKIKTALYLIIITINLIIAQKQDKASVKNTTLYKTAIKSENYQMAEKHWNAVFENCLNPSKNLFNDGLTIKRALIEKEKNKEIKLGLIKSIFKLHSKITNCLGENPNFLQEKAYDLYFFEKDSLLSAYNILASTIKTTKENTKKDILVVFMSSTKEVFLNGNIDRQTVLNNYSNCEDYINIAIIKENNGKEKDKLEEAKLQIEQKLFETNILFCDDIAKLFQKKYTSNPNDTKLLKRIINAYKSNNCDFNPQYFNALETLFKIKPSSYEAYYYAKALLEKSNYIEAEKVFNFVAENEDLDSKEIKSECFYILANFANNRDSLDQAKKLAKKSILLDSNNALVFMLLGKIFEKKSINYSKDNFINKTIYWTIVDQFEKAKTLDSKLENEANQKIELYSKNFPKIEEIFFQGLEEEHSYKIEGWFNEITKVRISK